MDYEHKYELVEREFGNAYKEVLRLCERNDTDYGILPKRFKLTTMTILVYLNYRINLSVLCEKFDPSVLEGNWKVTKSGCFYNSVLLTKQDPKESDEEESDRKCGVSTVAIKIFSNGNLHMTGVKSVKHSLQLGHTISRLLNKIFDVDSDGYEVEDFDIQLRNGCFRFEMEKLSYISLPDMLKVLLDTTKHFCIFNNDSHAGLRIKITNEECETTSIIVFESGNVLLNAFKTGSDLMNAFRFISDFINQNINIIIKQSTPEAPSSCTPSKDFDYTKYIILK
jgi:TATA-box binding protein (TBP) (component of TFIID and TFIIIB)